MSIFRTLSIFGTSLVASGLLYSCSLKNNEKGKQKEIGELLCGEKASLNGIIEFSKQGSIGNCYMLSQLNSLSFTKWGSKVIKDAIKLDNNGGAYVTLKDTNDNDKIFHITADEISNIRKEQTNINDLAKKAYFEAFTNGLSEEDCDKKMQEYLQESRSKYSSGDDDILVLELAIEKYFKSLGYSSKDILDASNSPEGDIIKLMTGKKERQYYEGSFNKCAIDEYFCNKKDEIVATASFNNNNLNLITNHAYSIKGIKNDNKILKMILVNPHDSSKEIEIDYYDFIFNCKEMIVWEPGDKHTYSSFIDGTCMKKDRRDELELLREKARQNKL